MPNYDVAAELARAVIEGHQELIYKAFVKALSKGNAYAFQVLSDRGYGNLRRRVRLRYLDFDGVSDEKLQKHIEELEELLANDLGYVKKVEPQLLPPADDPKVQLRYI